MDSRLNELERTTQYHDCVKRKQKKKKGEKAISKRGRNSSYVKVVRSKRGKKCKMEASAVVGKIKKKL